MTAIEEAAKQLMRCTRCGSEPGAGCRSLQTRAPIKSVHPERVDTYRQYLQWEKRQSS